MKLLQYQNNIVYLKCLLLLVFYFLCLKLTAQNIKDYKWKNRILIIKTTDSKSKIYQSQISEFKNANQTLKDRKCVLFKITGNRFEIINFTNHKKDSFGILSKEIHNKFLNEKENFEVILVGLDGSVKKRHTGLLRKEDVFNTIDTMPMRRNELRNKKN